MSETPTSVSVPETAPEPQPPPQPFAERLSDTLQHLIQIVIGSQRKPPRRLKSLLNGTWFGHPLHPVITDIPVTAWMLTALFDIIWLISHTSWSAYGAFVTVIVGLVGALGAIVTGLTDWSDTYGSERRVGLDHAMYNAAATLLYLVSFVLPFHGHAYLGYIAHEHIIGISKLTRLVRLFARRFAVQERIGQQIADTLEAMLAPHGVAVYLEAHHLCTQMRGVREVAPLTRTTFWRGEYESNAALRTEFFNVCGVRG